MASAAIVRRSASTTELPLTATPVGHEALTA